MAAGTREGRTRIHPEPASAGVVVLLSLATLASGVGSIILWSPSLAAAALVSGIYVLHLMSLRRSADDAVIAIREEARHEAYMLKLEYERLLLDAARLEPELEKERARLKEQWSQLRGMVEDRESRKQSLNDHWKSLEQARDEAQAALEEARRRVREKEAREQELERRIEELEISRASGIDAQHKLEKLKAHLHDLRAPTITDSPEHQPADASVRSEDLDERKRELERRVAELESERRSAELALKHIGSSSAPGSSMEQVGASPARTTEPAKLRAWQFVAHRRNRRSRPA
jgi:DNA repair exonuclease SbcCD ATPase subunit